MQNERDRLRDVLAFPASVETSESLPRSKRPVPPPPPSDGSPDLTDLSARVDRLTTLVETVLARVPETVAAPTDHESDLEEILVHIGHTLLAMQKDMTQVRDAVPEINELAIMAHVDRWFEETNSRLANDVEHLRRDIHRVDQALVQLHADIASSPASSSAVDASVGDVLSDVRQLVADMPRHVALQDPVARLDAAIIEQVEQRVATMASDVTHTLESELDSKMQRFEALSRSMMVLVGEPLDRLTEKVQHLATSRDRIEGDAPSTAQLEAAVEVLRTEGREREALLRHLLNRLEWRTGASPPPGDPASS